MLRFVGTRWRKVVRDIWENKARTILVVLAIAVGVFAFGGMFITRTVLIENMNQGFSATNPATINVNIGGFDESLVRTVRTFPYVDDVEAVTTRSVQIWTGDRWMSLEMVAVSDFEDMDINTLGLERGTLSPQRRQILFERQSLPNIAPPDPSICHQFSLPDPLRNALNVIAPNALACSAGIGDSVVIELPDTTQRELEIVGVVHDFSAVPGSRIPILTGYVSLDTMRQLGLSSRFDELKIVTVPQVTTLPQLEAAADEIIDRLDRYGYRAGSFELTEPGKHWAADFIKAVVLVLVILGLLALGLAGFLVVNTITGLLAQQKRQVGMMKAIGATTGDVMGIFLAMAGVYGALSLLVALPLGVLLSRGMVLVLADFLNINISTFRAPLWILGLQVAAALITPLLAAVAPIIRGARTTVREAVSDYGITSTKSAGFIDRFLTSLRGVSRPVLLSLRNTFRRRGRLILTLVTLSVAGGIFIGVLNTRTAILAQFQTVLDMFGYDVMVFMTRAQPVSRLQREAARVDGVNRTEGWGFASGTIIRPEEELGIPTPEGPREPQGPPGAPQEVTDEEGTSLLIFAPPPDSPFLSPTMIEGRWLRPGDTNAIVIGSEVLGTEPWIDVGDEIKLDFGNINRTMVVVGIVNLVGPEFGYAPFETITRWQGAQGRSQVAMLGTTVRTDAYREAVARQVEEHYQQIGIGVQDTMTPSSFIGVITSMIDFFVFFMLFMAILLGLVGGLGLTSTMSLNVLERTREIGVMRAIGASNMAMRAIFLAEGIMIGLMSYVISALISFPISLGFVIGVGNAFFDRPIPLKIEPMGFAAWLGIVLVLATVASLAPANRAASVSVRESLAYE